MSGKIIKNAFVSGIVASINGKPYTRLLSKEEEMLKNAPVRTKQELEEIDRLMMESLKTDSPDFYKKIYEKKE